MNYEETANLEENIKIKNEANDLYRRFVKFVKLSVARRDKNEFEDWADAHNRAFYRVNENSVSFHCRFLHETYNLTITPSSLFESIKSNDRGLLHFKSSVDNHEKKANEGEERSQNLAALLRESLDCEREKSLEIEKLKSEKKELEELVETLSKAIAYSRKFFHLSQKVCDVFNALVSDTLYDKRVETSFYDEIINDHSLKQRQGRGE